MSTLSIPVGMMLSISAYVGLYHLLLYFRRRQYREYLFFALLCLSTSLYDVFCIGLYHATTVSEGVHWQRAQLIALALFMMAFFWFVSAYTRSKSKRGVYAFTAFYLSAFFIQLLDRSSITWMVDRPTIKEIVLPLGLNITYHEAAFGTFTTIQSLMGLLAIVYILWCGINYYRYGNKREARWLLVALGLMALAGINDTAVGNGLYQFIYTIEYGYMAMILLMAYSLSTTVVEAAIAKESLMKSEERFRALVETTSDWVWEIDANGVYTYCSPKILALLGYEPEEMIGKTPFDLMPPEDAQRVKIEFQRSVAKGKEIEGLENVNLHKDGRLVILETRGLPFFDSKGNLVGYRGIDRDITERRNAEQALRESETRFRTLAEASFEGIVLTEGGRVVDFNDQTAHMLGYTHDELVGMSVLTAVAPESHGLVSEAIRTNRLEPYEHLAMRKDGRIFPVEVRARTTRMGDRLLRVTAIRDITERKRAEDALRESRNLLQTILDTIPARVFWKDTTLTYLGCNQPFAHDAGVATPDEVIGKDDYQMAWHDQADLYRGDDQRVIESGVPKLSYEEPQTTPDGRQIWLRTSKVPLQNTDGVNWGVLGTYEDITEYKQVESALRDSEEKYRSIVETALTGIYTVDDSFHVIYANDELCRISLYPREELLGLDFRKVLAPDSYALVAERYTRRLSGEQEPQRYEFNIIRRDGKETQVEMSVVVTQDTSGRPRLIGQLVDIAERKQAEAERERLITELESKNAELERFTYTVSHDLKSPLVTIRGFLGYLEKDAMAGNVEQLKTDISRIQKATDKMQQLLNELLELSRIGRMMNPAESVAFDNIVNEALELVRGRLEARSVQVDVLPNLPIVHGDRARLVEVMQNLIDNAAKFMGSQPAPRIEIGCRGEEHDRAILYVKDNGIGIALQYFDRVFGLFNKLDANTEGSGVGLALTKRIIEVHNGSIWIESEGAGRGTTFWLTLPMAGKERTR